MRHHPQKAPSSAGKPKEFSSEQNKSPPAFHFNRPPQAAATIPITLYEEAFAQFQEDCETYSPSQEDHAFVLNFSYAMSQFYRDETARGHKARELLDGYGVHLFAGVVGKNYTMDGHGQGKRTPAGYSIFELKNELSAGGAEPLFQAGWYFATMTRDEVLGKNFHFPCFIFYMAGLLCVTFHHRDANGFACRCSPWIRWCDVDN